MNTPGAPSFPRHLYVHVPFCARRCIYCDFAIAVRRDVPAAEYVRDALTELCTRTAQYGVTTPALDTLYFGGGTPSRLGVDLAALTRAIREHVGTAHAAEITAEANPDDITRTTAHAWHDAGMTRISLGAQSFDDEVLKWMHRPHDAAAVPRAVTTLRDAGIDDISVDLIFALPHGVARDWRRDLSHALALEPTHLSLYGLTIEPATPLGRIHARGSVNARADEGYEEEFLEASRTLTAAGFEHYEVSNFAKPGHRARHNSSYWQGVPYEAIGPSAHRFDGTSRSWNIAAWPAWSAAIRDGATVVAGAETLDEDARAVERVYLGLRTVDGLAATDAERTFARPWIDAGWAVLRGDRLVLTPTGWLRLDALALALTRLGSH